MQNQNIRLFLYSSLAIVALMLVWGFRTIPKQAELAEKELRTSLEQELIVLNGAVKSATTAMKYRLLDVLKAEGNDHNTRAFQDSPFVSSALLEWDSSQWKTNWHSSKLKEQFQAANLRKWMEDWPVNQIANEEAFFAKVADVDGTPYFAIVVPVRRPNNNPMLGVGVFPAGQFGLTFASGQTREIRVFDNKGFALALSHPAYLGASLKREPLVTEILDGDAVSVRQEWKSERGIPLLGLAARMSDSNLFAAVETEHPLKRAAMIQSWLYLLFCAAGAVGINWFLFSSMIRPLFLQLNQTEELVEKMRRQMAEQPSATFAPVPAQTEPPAGDQIIPSAELPDIHFIENGTAPAAKAVAAADETPAIEPAVKTPMSKVVAAALRALDTRLKENKIFVNRIGLDDIEVESDVLQLQTAVEEVLKNAVEAMAESKTRQLTIAGQRMGSRAHFSVEDTGSGIAEENLKKVFDPFYSTKDSEGVARGLGLNVVRRVVEELHGNVTVRNRKGESGVIVEIEWPLEKNAVTTAPQATAEQIETRAEEITERFNLALLEDEYGVSGEDFEVVPAAAAKRDWPEVPIRKPKVRTLD